MTNTIKIKKAVTQEVEVSREDLIKELSGGKNQLAKVGDLVMINTKTNSAQYGTKAICNTIGLIMGTTHSSYHPWSGSNWGKITDRTMYTINYKGCGDCVETAYLGSDQFEVL